MLVKEFDRHIIKGRRNLFVALRAFTYGTDEDRWGVQFIRVHNHAGTRWESTEGGTFNIRTYRLAAQLYQELAGL